MKLRLWNPDNPEDVIFMAELQVKCDSVYFPVSTYDPTMTVLFLEKKVREEQAVAFVGELNGKRVGAFWVDLEEDIGLFGAALAPEARKPLVAWRFLKLFFDVAFTQYNWHKLEAHVTLRDPKAERLCRALGMRKEGVLRERLNVGINKRLDLLILGILQTEWLARETSKKTVLRTQKKQATSGRSGSA